MAVTLSTYFLRKLSETSYSREFRYRLDFHLSSQQCEWAEVKHQHLVWATSLSARYAQFNRNNDISGLSKETKTLGKVIDCVITASKSEPERMRIKLPDQNYLLTGPVLSATAFLNFSRNIVPLQVELHCCAYYHVCDQLVSQRNTVLQLRHQLRHHVAQSRLEFYFPQQILVLLFVLERFSFECRKVIGFAFTTLRDWFQKLTPLFHPIRSKTKTNRDSLERVFPHFASATCNYFPFWLVHLIIFALCDWLEWLLWFWFYDTIENRSTTETTPCLAKNLNSTLGIGCRKARERGKQNKYDERWRRAWTRSRPVTLGK